MLLLSTWQHLNTVGQYCNTNSGGCVHLQSGVGIRPGVWWQPGSIVEYYSNYDNWLCLQSGMRILQAICWHPGSVVDWYSMANAFSCRGVWKPDRPFAGIQVFSWCGILTATSVYACRVVRKSDQPFAGVQVILRSDISNEDERICLQSGAEVWPAVWRHPADRVWWLLAAPPCVQGQKRSLLLPGQGQS